MFGARANRVGSKLECRSTEKGPALPPERPQIEKPQGDIPFELGVEDITVGAGDEATKGAGSTRARSSPAGDEAVQGMRVGGLVGGRSWLGGRVGQATVNGESTTGGPRFFAARSPKPGRTTQR